MTQDEYFQQYLSTGVLPPTPPAWGQGPVGNGQWARTGEQWPVGSEQPPATGNQPPPTGFNYDQRPAWWNTGEAGPPGTPDFVRNPKTEADWVQRYYWLNQNKDWAYGQQEPWNAWYRAPGQVGYTGQMGGRSIDDWKLYASGPQDVEGLPTRAEVRAQLEGWGILQPVISSQGSVGGGGNRQQIVLDPYRYSGGPGAGGWEGTYQNDVYVPNPNYQATPPVFSPYDEGWTPSGAWQGQPYWQPFGPR